MRDDILSFSSYSEEAKRKLKELRKQGYSVTYQGADYLQLTRGHDLVLLHAHL